MSKEKLISEIKQFFLNNEPLDGVIDLCQTGSNFETSTGVEEGSIEIVSLTSEYFIYTPSGELDEMEGEFEKLTESDLEQIISGLEDWKAEQDQTSKRAGI